ncbi:MAG: four helix bundle protein [Ignavibacteriae bacterium]|nr:MAG: four helix bundle protein [Ignavibacteriota bacterium]
MSKINRFEDILAWQKARELTSDLYKVMECGKFQKDFTLKNQMLGAALSIMLNIAEGFGRRTNKEFVNFLGYAHGSTAEVQSALYVALDQKYYDLDKFNSFYEKCDEVSKLIMGFMKYLENN